MLGVQQVGTWVWLKTLKPAQHGTSKKGMVRKNVGLISELYLPAMVGETGVTKRGSPRPGWTLWQGHVRAPGWKLLSHKCHPSSALTPLTLQHL